MHKLLIKIDFCNYIFCISQLFKTLGVRAQGEPWYSTSGAELWIFGSCTKSDQWVGVGFDPPTFKTSTALSVGQKGGNETKRDNK